MISWAYLTQGIRTIINYLASSTKSATVNKVVTKKNHKGTVSNVEFTDKIKTSKFQIFVVKLKFLLHFIYILLLTLHWC